MDEGKIKKVQKFKLSVFKLSGNTCNSIVIHLIRIPAVIIPAPITHSNIPLTLESFLKN